LIAAFAIDSALQKVQNLMTNVTEELQSEISAPSTEQFKLPLFQTIKLN
jgi:hypothetical protein